MAEGTEAFDLRAAAELEAALKEQARLGDALARVAGTSAEFAAYTRLQEATRRVSRFEGALGEARPAAG